MGGGGVFYVKEIISTISIQKANKQNPQNADQRNEKPKRQAGVNSKAKGKSGSPVGWNSSSAHVLTIVMQLHLHNTHANNKES